MTEERRRENADRVLLDAIVKFANPDLVAMGLADGADPNLRDKDGFAALELAAVLPDGECLEVLLAAGADPNLRGHTGGNALHAVGSVAGCAALVAKGADVNRRDGGGLTPLHCACLRDDAAVADFLLRHGADPEMRDARGRTPADLTDDDATLAAFLAWHAARDATRLRRHRPAPSRPTARAV